MKKDLKYKLKVIHGIFYEFITDYRGEPIDYYDPAKDQLCTAAERIAETYLYKSRFPTKDDLLTINRVVMRITNILGTDDDKITEKYVASKILRYGKPFKPNKTWIKDYKKLLELIKNNEPNTI